MKHTKLFTLFTAAILSVSSILPDAALTAAAEELPAEGAVSEAGSFQIAGSDNTFGAMLAAEINQENARVMSGCVIHGVEMQDNTAEVSLEANRGGTAVVCVYTDPSCNEKHVPKLLASGMQTFTADQKSVSVEMALDSLPAFYLIRAYLIGENQVPLSMEYTDPTHTLEMQQLIDSDISDYADYQVLNMDDSTDTNFAVYKQDVQVLKTSGTENLVTAQDNEKCTYTIQNYTGPTEKGKVVSIEGGNGTAAIFRIQSVKKSGNVTTVQGSTAMDPQDAFAYIKVETNSENNEYSYTAPTPEGEYADIPISGEVVGGEKPAQGRPSVSAAADSGEEDVTHYVNEKMFRIQFGKGADQDSPNNEHNLTDVGVGVEANGIVEFSFGYDIAIYHTGMFDSITLDCSQTFDYGVELSATFEIKLPLGAAVICNPCSDINFTLGPYLIATVTGMVRITGTFESSFGTEKGIEVHPWVADASLTAEGFFGFGIGGDLSISYHHLFRKNFVDDIEKDSAKGELSLEVGLQVALEENEKHDGCGTCYGLTLNVECRFTAAVEISVLSVGVAPTLDFELGKCYLSDTQGFGPGDCPNLQAHQVYPAAQEQEVSDDDGLTDEQRHYFAFTPTSDGYAIYSNIIGENHSGYLPEMPTYYKGVPVTEIVEHGFSNYRNIEHVILPKKLKRIGAHAFSKYDTANGYATGINQPFLYIPDTVEYIGNCAFACLQVSSLYLPDSLITIGDYAFARSSPASSKTEYHLKTLTVPGSVKNMGEYVFRERYDLETLNLQEGITEIPDSAFQYCRSLKTVNFPSTLEKIGAHAFEDAPEFPIRLPNGLRSIGENAFHFKDKDYINGQETDSIDPYDVTIPATVTEIGENAFGNCKHINNLTIRNGFTGTIHEDAFSGMSKGIYWDLNIIHNLYLPDNWETIPNRIFHSTYIDRVYLPSGLLEIGEGAFGGSHIKQIVFPKSLIKIGRYALSENRLQSLILPSSLTKIEDGAFRNSNYLKSIFIPGSVKTIGNGAFAGSSEIETVEIPSSVESISASAFDNCGAISIYFPNPDIEFIEDPDNPLPDYAYARICGFSGSTAETFAKEHDIKFTQLLPAYKEKTTPRKLIQVSNMPESSVTFKDLKPNTVYNFYYQSPGELSAENLLYLAQGVSDSDGTLTVNYLPKLDISNGQSYVRCCDEEEIPAEPEVSTVRGDVNGDYRVDVSDVVLLARFCAEDRTVKISTQGLRNADVTKDGKPDSNDTTQMLKFIARLIDSFD